MKIKLFLIVGLLSTYGIASAHNMSGAKVTEVIIKKLAECMKQKGIDTLTALTAKEALSCFSKNNTSSVTISARIDGNSAVIESTFEDIKDFPAMTMNIHNRIGLRMDNDECTSCRSLLKQTMYDDTDKPIKERCITVHSIDQCTTRISLDTLMIYLKKTEAADR